MGWREWMRNHVVAWHGVNPSVKKADLAAAVLSMPPADRIALARELLAGTGRVVARDVDAIDLELLQKTEVEAAEARGHKHYVGRILGWNACRAAMLEP